MWVSIIPIFTTIYVITGHEFNGDIQILTDNLFHNLQSFPNVQIIDGELSLASKKLVDQQIQNYIKLITYNEPESRSGVKKKRSLFDQITQNPRDVLVLSDIQQIEEVTLNFPEDITHFELNSKLYIAALESSNSKEAGSNLVIFEHKNKTLDEIVRISVRQGVKISTVNIENYTIIAVAENDTVKENFGEKSGAYKFNGFELVKIQSFDMNYASDIVIWRINNEVYMSIAQFMSNQSGIFYYNVEIPIYKWLGKHFDLVQTVLGTGTIRVVPFQVNFKNYLALCNFRDNSGQTQLYSEIYKFDYDTETFKLYQNILTEGCTDIAVFNLWQDDFVKDTFLVVANSQEFEFNDDISYETDSIIYKYIDGYFIPFQTLHVHGITRWLPIEAPQKEFVLLALTRFDGIKSYQFDGWSFREVSHKRNKILENTNIKSLQFLSYNNTPTLVVSTKNNIVGLFHFTFTKHNNVYETYKDMCAWCEKSTEKVELLFRELEPLLERSERADIVETDEITSKIEALNSMLENISFPEITANEIIFNNTLFVTHLETNKINNFNVENLMANVLDIEKGFEIENITFESVQAGDGFKPTILNGNDCQFFYNSSQNLRLTVDGTIFPNKGIQIGGTLNGIKVDTNNILLKDGDQNITKPVTVNVAHINDLTANSINGANLERLLAWDRQPITVNHVSNLTVTDLTIGGYINDVDIPTLDELILKITEDQNVTAEYTFDELIVNDLEVQNTINGRKVSDLIGIDSGSYTIEQDLIFNKDLEVNNLQILKSLNGIHVKEGKLDVLYKNQTEEQHVTGFKIFENVTLHNPISLQGHIDSEILNKFNPVVTIEDDLVLEGDYSISGDVLVENCLDVDDIKTEHGNYSLTRLRDQGVKLTDKVIKPHLHFVQQLNVGEILVDCINGKDPADFVVVGTDEPQIIEGLKIFTGDLYIDGIVNAKKINDVDMEELENNALNLQGQQTIVGKHHIKNVIINGTVEGKIKIGSYVLGDEANERDNITMVFNGDLDTDEIRADHIIVKGLVNGLNFNQIINDTVMHDSTDLITGEKSFENLIIEELQVETGINIQTEEITHVAFENSVETESIKIENLYFDDRFNGVPRDDFGKSYVDENDTIPVYGDQIFDTIVIYSQAFIASNKINDVEIRSLAEDTVKIDEPFEFTSASFDTIVSKQPLILHGHIENLDFDNVVWSNSDLEQVVWDEKIFKSNLTIKGNVTFEGLVNGLNITHLCDFVAGKIADKNLTIEGNAYFARNPNVVHINNVNITTIMDRAWFSDEDTVLTGNFEFGNVVFEKDIIVEGFVDNVSLKYLSENYLSKTKDQTINATLNFQDGVVFEGGASSPRLTLNGEINGINLDEITRTVLLDGFDQVFETTVFIENCTIKNLTGDNFLVNGLNLEQDVMRYDKNNMVTGKKSFGNLTINNLNLNKNINIQGVDVLSWYKNAVLKNSTYNISGTKTFRNVVFSGNLRLDGTLNGLKMDKSNILLKNVPQEITGHKTFHSNSSNPITFKSIKLKGLLNGIDLQNLINNAAYTNQDNTIQTSINLHNNITTKNLIINKLYQDLNVTDLIANVTNLGALNNLVEQFQNLEVMSFKLKKSLENQAYFLHHYKTIQTIPFMENSMKIIAPDQTEKIGILKRGKNDMEIDLYSWSHEEEQFTKDSSIKFSNSPRVVAQILNNRYLYIEDDDEGILMHIYPNLEHISSMPTNKTKSTTSFTLPSIGNSCTLFIYYEGEPKIYCEASGNITLMQVLEAPRAYEARSITVQETLYTVISNEPLEGVESQVDVWQYNPQTAKFALHQSFFEAHPKSLSTASFNNFHYLVVASGHLSNVMYSGRVEIRRFDETINCFKPLQTLEIDAPIQVELSILPSNELVLYVVTDNPSEPLLIYRYEGIAGFTLKVRGSVLAKIHYINLFLGGAHRHFIVAQNNKEINVIEAIFKGEKGE